MAPKLKPQKIRNVHLREKRKLKSNEAQVRREAASKRTPQEQLARLDTKLGAMVGATRERTRLHARIQAATKKKC